MSDIVEKVSIEDLFEAFSAIVGYETVKEEMVQMCDTIVNREFYSRLGADIPRGLLLSGRPGVGKTTIAECIADVCGLPVFRVRKQTAGSEFIDQIKQAFVDAAENAPSIVLLDDLDKFEEIDLTSMEALQGSMESFTVLQACIDDVADSDVLIVATANDTDILPSALFRDGRIDRVRTIYPPAIHDAEKILRKYLEGKSLAADVDYSSLAVLLCGGSCARIETLANDAAILAGYDRSAEITMDHIARAYIRWHSGKVDEDLTPEERLRVACHEAGHIVIMEQLMPGVMDFACAKRDKEAKVIDLYMDGVLLGIHDDRNKMIALKDLGGKAAIQLVYGEPDDMSINDVMSACFHAYERVINGYDEYMDLIQLSMGHGSSEVIMQEIESAVEREMEEMYSEALNIISANRGFLDRLTQALYENDYLLRDDIRKLKG